jgi:cytochrome c biogenesis protein CcdA
VILSKTWNLIVLRLSFFSLLCVVFFVGLIFLFLQGKVNAESGDKIYFFYGEGCPHCSQVLNFFEKENLLDKYQIEKREIYFNHDNALLYTQMLDDLNFPFQKRGVPIMIIGDRVLVGDLQIINNFSDQPYDSVNIDDYDSEPVIVDSGEKYPDLTLMAVIMGSLVDAINPCAFAVLIILMTTVISTKDSRRALYSGLSFSASIFISYFLMGLGLYKALSLGMGSVWFFRSVGLLAIILGLANLKDYFWYGKGFLIEVPLSWRPRMKKIIHSVTSPVGAFFVGFVVSLFLLPCTSGPYIVILGMLAKKTFDFWAVFYLVLYNLIFIFPMIFISLIVYKGFDVKKIERIRQSNLRLLHLVAGVVMLLMATIILGGWI